MKYILGAIAIGYFIGFLWLMNELKNAEEYEEETEDMKFEIGDKVDSQKEKHIIEVVQVSPQLDMIKWSDNTIDFHRKEKDDE